MTMRALVVHNFYRSENASGENLSVRDEISGLRELGWDVELIGSDSDVISSDNVSIPRLALRPIHSPRSVRRVREAIDRFRPHVALVENVFPLHSPSVIRTLLDAGVPVAAGIRSYRMWCAASTMFRDGSACSDCLGTITNAPAVRHGCFQQSSVRTVPMAWSLAVHRRTFRDVDAFFPVSEHVRDEAIRAGLPASRMIVRSNFVSDPGSVSPIPSSGGFLFAGRLSEDKGISLLLDAWERSGLWRTQRLRIAGSGELRGLVEGQRLELNVEALGLLDHADLLELLPTVGVMVIPSAWPEPFGRGVIEAAAAGRASVVTDVGGLPGLVVDGVTGWIAEPTAASLASQLLRAADLETQASAGGAARERYLERYTRQASLGVLDDTLRRLAVQGRDLTTIPSRRPRPESNRQSNTTSAHEQHANEQGNR